jgi:hypothetical protein
MEPMTDLDIITKSNRIFASIYANTEDGKDWIRRHFGGAKTNVMATFPAACATEYVLLIVRDKLVVKVTSL